jgi:probable F420-dependent oxidoreductase
VADLAPGAVGIGVALPQSAEDGEQPSDRITRFARAAERLGFDSVWTMDRTHGRQALIEPLTALTVAATATRRIRLGVAVVILPLRAPLELARTAASLDRLSDGRLDLGVGLGAARERVTSIGLDPARRADRMLDAVHLMRAMWTGEPVTFEGRTLSVHQWTIRPTPVQRPGPPVWFGGHHPDALRRAALLGDGWLGAGSTSLDDFDREVAVVRSELAAAGRSATAFGLGKRLYLALENRSGSRRRELRQWLVRGYGEAVADRVAVTGPPAAITEAVLRIVQQGGRVVILHPVADQERQLRELADEVVPAIRQAVVADAAASVAKGSPGGRHSEAGPTT